MARRTISSSASASASGLEALELNLSTFTTALATLVADGASPTEEHVTAVNDAWSPIATILGKDVVVDFNMSNITTLAKLDQAFATARQQARNCGLT